MRIHWFQRYEFFFFFSLTEMKKFVQITSTYVVRAQYYPTDEKRDEKKVKTIYFHKLVYAREIFSVTRTL